MNTEILTDTKFAPAADGVAAVGTYMAADNEGALIAVTINDDATDDSSRTGLMLTIEAAKELQANLAHFIELAASV
jgi:hypothetical protein